MIIDALSILQASSIGSLGFPLVLSIAVDASYHHYVNLSHCTGHCMKPTPTKSCNLNFRNRACGPRRTQTQTQTPEKSHPLIIFRLTIVTIFQQTVTFPCFPLVDVLISLSLCLSLSIPVFLLTTPYQTLPTIASNLNHLRIPGDCHPHRKQISCFVIE
jgi:hypothetical protein